MYYAFRYIKTCLLFIMVLLACSFIYAQPRDLVWLHGFGGTNVSWQIYDPLYTSQYAANVNQSYRFTYDLGGGYASSATDALNNLQPIVNPAQSFCIGHSSGGLTIAQIEAANNGADNFFGGYITAGSAFGGAPFAHSFANGDVEDFFDDMCQEVATDVAEAFLGLDFFDFFNDLDALVCGEVWNLVTAGLADFTSPGAIRDLAPGSIAGDVIRDYDSEKPRICIWGNEQSPVHWRWIQSTREGSKPFDLSLNETDDSGLASTMNTIEDVERVLGFVTLADAFTGFLSFSPFGFLSGGFGMSLNRSSQLFQGANWLDNSETTWNELIGASGVASVVTWHSSVPVISDYCASQIESHGLGWYYGLPICEQLACYDFVTQTVDMFNNGQSDGLVPRFNTYGPEVPNNRILEVVGANHQELVNHENMTNHLEDIFLGEVDPFFDLQ